MTKPWALMTSTGDESKAAVKLGFWR